VFDVLTHNFCGRKKTPMRNKERWQELCKLAAVEQDSEKLLALVQEINRLLDEKRNRLLNKQSGADESQTESGGDCS
jgi:hypothetical protein